MKALLWTLVVGTLVVAAAIYSERQLNTQIRLQTSCRANQSPEAQALLSQEWARAHALPIR